MPSLVVSYSHGDEDIDRTVEATDEALGVYRALEEGVERYLSAALHKVSIGKPISPKVLRQNDLRPPPWRGCERKRPE